MATSTTAAIRDDQVGLINALTVLSHGGDPFRDALDEVDFREWAEDNPTAAFRRYTIEEIPATREHGEIINTTEWVQVDLEMVMAYPHDFRYGPDNRRDMRDTIEQDRDQITDRIGDRGYGNYTETVAVQLEGTDTEIGDAVTFSVLQLRVGYHRSVNT